MKKTAVQLDAEIAEALAGDRHAKPEERDSQSANIFGASPEQKEIVCHPYKKP